MLDSCELETIERSSRNCFSGAFFCEVKWNKKNARVIERGRRGPPYFLCGYSVPNGEE